MISPDEFAGFTNSAADNKAEQNAEISEEESKDGWGDSEDDEDNEPYVFKKEHLSEARTRRKTVQKATDQLIFGAVEKFNEAGPSRTKKIFNFD